MHFTRILIGAMLVASVSGTSFGAGYLVATGGLDHLSVASSLPEILDFAGGRQASVATSPPSLTSDTRDRQFGIFWETWNLVEQEFYDQTAVDYQRMTYGAIRGMLEALNDPHTTFSNPDRARANAEEMRGAFEGIGITVEIRDEKLTIISPLPGSPAEKAGLKSGDAIIEVDGRNIVGISVQAATGIIRGPAGTTVQILVERPGMAAPFNVSVRRDRVRIVAVTSRALNDEIVYVKVSTFAGPTGNDLIAALKELKIGQRRGIVLDLRNNPGGLMQSAIDVASQFLSDGVVLYEQRRDGVPLPFFARPGGLATNTPMVVLINGRSASASEIVAGALQDRGRATLIGEKTYGKDSVQNVHQLSDRSSVRVTFARWLTPQQQEISPGGLKPDIQVVMSEEDNRLRRDPQLDRAIEYLRASGDSFLAPAGKPGD
jgi:carboxyl-terminal processing protease